MVVKYRNDATAVLYVRLPGWLKNEITERCNTEGVSVTSWTANVLKHALEEEWALPDAPPAAAPIPTSDDLIRGYVRGETIIEPCGKPSPCERTAVIEVAGVGYCDHCNIRVT